MPARRFPAYKPSKHLQMVHERAERDRWAATGLDAWADEPGRPRGLLRRFFG